MANPWEMDWSQPQGQPVTQPVAQTSAPAAQNPWEMDWSQQKAAPAPQQTSKVKGNGTSPTFEEGRQRVADWANSPTTVDYSDIPASGKGLPLGERLADVGKVVGRGAVGVGTNLAKATIGGLNEWVDPETYAATSGTEQGGRGPSLNAMTSLAFAPATLKGVGAAGDVVGDVLAKGAAGPTQVAKTMVNGAKASSPEELQAEDLAFHNSANPFYKGMRQIGATYTPNSVSTLTGNLDDTLEKMDVLPNLAPVSNDVVQQLKNQEATGQLSLNHLDQYRYQLGDAKGKDAAVAAALRKVIDNHVNATTADDLNNGSPQAVALLNRARAEYTRSANFSDVSEILQKANGDPTKIKNGINTFLSDPDNTAGMLPAEKASLRRASQTSSGEAMSKMLGKLGFTIIPTNAQGNGVLPYLMLATETGTKAATSALVPHAAPLVALGTLSKAGNTLYGRGLAENALDLMRKRPMPDATFEPPEPSGGVDDPNDALFTEPKALPQQARGGKIKNMAKGGRVMPRPKYYPALEHRV